MLKLCLAAVVGTQALWLLAKADELLEDPVMGIPEMATRGKEAFMKAATANDPEGMTAKVSLNVLQFQNLEEFWAAWQWNDRPRKAALLIDDMENDYYQFVEAILPNVELLLKAFRSKGLPVIWSSWWRFGPDDGYWNTMDRFYGPKGWNTSLNALYIHGGKKGAAIIPSIAPTDEEQKYYMHKSYSLDMFDEHRVAWATDDFKGQTLHDILQKEGVDTVVQVGAWTDDCIMATAFHAFSLQYDVVTVEDGVSTAALTHYKALDVLRGSVAKVIPTAEVLSYIASESVEAAALPPQQKRASHQLEHRPLVNPAACRCQEELAAAPLHEEKSGMDDSAWLQMAQMVFLATFGPACFAMGWLMNGRTRRSRENAIKQNVFYAM